MNSTNMWVLTNGLDGGITKIVGDAVRFERERRIILTSRKKDFYVKLSKRDEVDDLPRLTVMGVVPKLQIDFDASKEGIVRNFKISSLLPHFLQITECMIMMTMKSRC